MPLDLPDGGRCFVDANDALVVALMRRHGRSDFVTNDEDFASIPGLTVWKPR
jgi:predicted nucleic acid-binding protein